MKKVLLTGATGLIGKYAIQPLLDAGFEVFVVSSKETEDKKTRRQEGKQDEKPTLTHWVQANLLDFSDIERVFEEVKPQYLLHFAWDTTPGSYLESNLNFNWMQSSLKMLEQFKLYGGKRAVFAGTCFEYKFQDSPLKEYGELNPTSTYAKCKNDLNKLATSYCEKNDINFGWGRIFYVYGEGEQEKRLIPYVINCLKQDKEFSTTAGELIKDYMFAGDIAAAFVKFLDSNVQGCVNICTGIPVKIKEIVSLIAKKLGKEDLIKFESEESTQPPIIVGDNLRLTKEVGYQCKYTLEQGLEKVLQTENS